MNEGIHLKMLFLQVFRFSNVFRFREKPWKNTVLLLHKNKKYLADLSEHG